MKKEKTPKAPKVEEPKFYDLEENSIEQINNIIDSMSFPFNIKRKIIGVSNQKCLIKLAKTSPITTHLSGIELLICINEDYLVALEEECSKILIHQELDRIETDIQKGSFKLGKFKLQTNEGILHKYGIDAVAKANQLSDLYTKQKKDSDETFDINSENVQHKVKLNKTKDVEFLN